MSNLKKLEDGLKINEHSLDIALRDHPDLFYEVALASALAISNRDQAKFDLDAVEALVDSELRQAASVSGEKTTEKEIDSNKKVDKRVQAANKKFFDEKFNAAKWAALEAAYEQKSKSLSKLVDLYLSGYFSDMTDIKREVKGSELRNAQVKKINAERRRVTE